MLLFIHRSGQFHTVIEHFYCIGSVHMFKAIDLSCIRGPVCRNIYNGF